MNSAAPRAVAAADRGGRLQEQPAAAVGLEESSWQSDVSRYFLSFLLKTHQTETRFLTYDQYLAMQIHSGASLLGTTR